MEAQANNRSRYWVRVLAGALLLVPAAWYTRATIDGLSERRDLRTELAEISHVRYGLLNADRWRDILLPIVTARIDALDLKAASQANLRPMVERSLYRLLDDIKNKMSSNNSPDSGGGGLLAAGNAMIANVMVASLKPHVPEYATVVLAEFGRPEYKKAIKEYLSGVLAEGAKATFGNVDMRWYSYILKKHGCADADSCRQRIGEQVAEMDAGIAKQYWIVLGASAIAFLVLVTGGPVRRSGVVLLLLFCLMLLAGGVLTPMLEVEAKISKLSLTLLGKKVTFEDQLLYFRSKSVLEVFQSLIARDRPDMWVVGVLVLTFSVIFPALKILTLGFSLQWPGILKNRLLKFLALESSKWSMADVMALAIFMSYVAFNGLISNTMEGLRETGAEIVIPTDSSKILPGYYLFIGYCMASLVLSAKMQKTLAARMNTDEHG
ncbi:MAG TPA: paraquat-inducible protein A [Candidatus Solibacter sp.]|nr:paraquat-inducible protein A [Candidatus Solibacter sp.]